MTTPERDFWRLFGNYEDLTGDETVAIREGNYSALNDIHPKKKVILDELARLGKVQGLHREHPALKPRLAALIAHEQQNTLAMEEKLAMARRNGVELDSSTQRLRAIGARYKRGARPGALCVQG